MINIYFGFIIIFLTFILLIWCLSVILNKNETFKNRNRDRNKLDSIDHLELAYKLCSNQEDYPLCLTYIKHFENLKKSFKKLKKNFCKKFPSRCKELNIL